MHLNQKIFREDNIAGNQQKLFETMPGTKPILLKNQVEPRNMEWTHSLCGFLSENVSWKAAAQVEM